MSQAKENPVVAAFLLPGSPLPMVHPDNPPWGRLAAAMTRVGERLEAAQPDTVLIYSTQWIAVLDQLWLTRERLQGIHVDENWHEYGDLPFDIRIDTELAAAAVTATRDAGIKAKGVDYDGFPVDTGTIVAANYLNAERKRPLVVTANNVYHDWDRTRLLGRIAVDAARSLGRTIAVVGVGGLSGTFFRHTIDVGEDRIAAEDEDRWNRKVLGLMEAGDVEKLVSECPRYVKEARVDMGFKHFAFILGALGDAFQGARLHAYEPLYGAGGAVVEFQI